MIFSNPYSGNTPEQARYTVDRCQPAESPQWGTLLPIQKARKLKRENTTLQDSHRFSSQYLHHSKTAIYFEPGTILSPQLVLTNSPAKFFLCQVLFILASARIIRNLRLARFLKPVESGGCHLPGWCFLVLTCAPSVWGEESPTAEIRPVGTDRQCSELVRECFQNKGLKKSNCFYSTAKHPFCEGSDTGNLIYRRWTLAADTTVGDKVPPGFFGPSAYDSKCISDCDNQWFGMLLQENTIQTNKQVSVCFDNCKVENPLEVLRP